MFTADKIMDHAEYPKRLTKLSHAELKFIANDAKEAMEANPDNPNNSYYADEINYCCNELYNRRVSRSSLGL